MTAFRILLCIVFTTIFCFVFGYLDYKVVTPFLPLPDDICFYHTNTPPTWVTLFYLDSSGHTEPPFSGLHILTLLLISLTVGMLLAIKTDNWLLKRQQNKQ